MQRLFGLPMGSLAWGLAAAVGLAVAVLTGLALRSRMLFKLGLRNVTRRRARTSLIVVGLMLGTTIIAAALITGDTVAHTVRSDVITALGDTDEIISVPGAENAYFPADRLAAVDQAVAGSDLVDGVAPVIMEQVAMVGPASGQSEPRVNLFAPAPDRLDGFGQIRSQRGPVVALSDLTPAEVLINQKAADDLLVSPGDEVSILAAGHQLNVTVADVVRFDGTGGTGPAVLMGLPVAQGLLDRAGQVDHILVSNRGGVTSGAGLTDRVTSLLEPTLSPLGLEATDAKRSGLDIADQVGAVFMSVFTTFGTFSIAAGILLIFLIFVMLAAERRGEMGIARAIGTHRRHLVQSYLFEGALYDILAAAVGTAAGLGVAFAMVSVMSMAFNGGSSDSFQIRYAVQPRSLVVAYALGVLFTLVLVTISAWRVSRLNITAAIRNLPEPLVRGVRRARWGWGLAVLVLAGLMVAGGVSSDQAMPTLVGVSLLIVGAVPLARTIGLADRPAYTVAGSALVVFWLLPLRVITWIFGPLSITFSVWVVGGLLVVLGVTWTIMYNADLILTAVQAVFGRIPALAPVLRTSMAYPLRNRFRTGITLAMFTLVVFTMVAGAVTTEAFTRSFDNVDAFGGGFDVAATASPASPLDDPVAVLKTTPGLAPGAVQAVAAKSMVPVEVRQAGAGDDPVDYPLRGLDDTFLRTTTYGLAIRATGYPDDAAVWSALRTDPTVAVIDAMSVPRRQNFSFGNISPLHLSGFHLEDRDFEPVPLEIRDPQTGQWRIVQVIGVLRDTATNGGTSGASMFGVSMSQAAMAPYGERSRPTTYLVKLAPGTDARSAARAIEAGFLANGMQADAVAQIVDEVIGANRTLNRLVLGFMGLGLIVGVAALGVISARAVVERRQQIGVLRAIGFQRSMVQLSFLLEAAFVAVTAIITGAVLGLIMGYNIVAESARQAAYEDLRFVVPWPLLLIVFGAVVVAAFAATIAPARRGSRVAPATALRYQ